MSQTKDIENETGGIASKILCLKYLFSVVEVNVSETTIYLSFPSNSNSLHKSNFISEVNFFIVFSCYFD